MNKVMVNLRSIVNQTLGALSASPLPVFILCYHGFGESSYPHNLSTSTFANQLDYLSRHVNFVSLDDIADFIAGKKVLTYPSVAITFDDGYQSLLEIRSIVAKYGIRPTVFVLSDSKRVNRMELDNQLPLLNKSGIRDLISSGWDIGSHTATHPNLKDISSQDELRYEIGESKRDLEKDLGITVKYFAYPKGQYSSSSLAIVAQSGYKLAFSMDDNPILHSSNKFTISRIGINSTHTMREYPTLFTPWVQLVRKLLK